jgi:chitin synthase
MAGLGQWGAGSVYGMPPNPMFAQNPFMTASPVGSEHGGMAMGMNMGQSPYGMMGIMNTNGGPRNSVMTNLNDFAAPSILNQQPTGGSRSGLAPPVRPYSTFSMANTANPFGDAPPEPAPMNYASEPTEDEIIKTLKADLACQDLTTLTRRKVREGVVAKFPNADLSGKTKFINESVDRLLSEL